MSTCYVCGDHVEVALQLEHRKCGHKAHVDCLTGPIDYKECSDCLSDSPSGRSAAAEGVRLPESGPACGRSAAAREPTTQDKVNYNLFPGKKAPSSKLLRAATYVPYLGSKLVETEENSSDPAFLLAHRVPVRTMMSRNGVGLDHCLRAGMTIDDFVTNGYTWNDLMQFEAVAGKRPGTSALQTITKGLQMQATHFRDYAEALPYATIAAHAGFEPYDLCQHFGLHFPDDGPLACGVDENWNARHCVALGLTIDDLRAFGMRYTEQYEDLMHGLSPKTAAEAELKLGATAAHLQALVSIEQLKREDERKQRRADPAPAGPDRLEQAPPRAHVQEYEPEYVQEYVPARVQEYVRAPPQGAPERKLERIPERKLDRMPERKAYVKASPQAAMPLAMTHETPVPKVLHAPAERLSQQRATRYDRHGARLVFK